MIHCEVCSKQFKSPKGLFGHKRVHNKLRGSYSVSRKKKIRVVAFCANCNQECRTKYCNVNCQQQHLWKTVTVPLIEAGKKDPKSNLGALVKFVAQRDGYKCNNCNLTNWLNEKISLDLDHIDGDNTNNYPRNLRLLCPNCHRQTPTWGNKKRSAINSVVEC